MAGYSKKGGLSADWIAIWILMLVALGLFAPLTYVIERGILSKAGEAVAGYVKVEEMLGRGRASVLLHAAEAQPDGCRKLDGMAGEGVMRCGKFRRDELDLAFGRSNVVHAAVARGGLAGKLREALRRMDVYEAGAAPQ